MSTTGVHTAVDNLFWHDTLYHMEQREKDPSAVALGKKGGANSRKNMSPEDATTLAKKAAFARHNKKTNENKTK